MDEGTPSSDMPHFEARNVLITGGAGFIASHVAILLATKYPRYRVVVVDKLDYCANLNNLRMVAGLLNFKFVKGDIRTRREGTRVVAARARR
jgi:dTDP-D-glucose 4,6-dehydratase